MFLTSYIQAQQNLITNGSFEIIDLCYGDPAPIGFDVFQWSGCDGWYVPSIASSDLWCENPVFGISTPPFITGVGFQYPRTGENMAGLIIYDVVYPNYREYIQNKLTTNLEKNKYYIFSLFINTVDTTYNATSCIQAYFSSIIINQLFSYNTLPLIPQFKNESSNFILDTLEWIKITGIYKAIGNEQYVVIGCFDDSASIVVRDTNSFTAAGVYSFIDDVSLVEAPFSINIPNVFTPNNDGFNDIFQPEIINIDDWEMKIYNRWGNKITTLNNQILYWNGNKSSSGTYFYVFNAPKLNITETGIITLFTN